MFFFVNPANLDLFFCFKKQIRSSYDFKQTSLNLYYLHGVELIKWFQAFANIDILFAFYTY